MESEIDIQKILDDAVRDITKRLAGIDLERAPSSLLEEDDDIASLYTATTGSFQIKVVCHAQTRLLRYIAEKMARRPVEDSEMEEVYVKEYFNILCGHVISKINRLTNGSARIGIPEYYRGFYVVDDCPGGMLEVSYKTIAGNFQVEGRYPEKQ